jgi:hypothetical protein
VGKTIIFEVEKRKEGEKPSNNKPDYHRRHAPHQRNDDMVALSMTWQKSIFRLREVVTHTIQSA